MDKSTGFKTGRRQSQTARGSPLFESKTRKTEPASVTGASERCALSSSLRITPPSLRRLKPGMTGSLPLSIPETSSLMGGWKQGQAGLAADGVPKNVRQMY